VTVLSRRGLVRAQAVEIGAGGSVLGRLLTGNIASDACDHDPACWSGGILGSTPGFGDASLPGGNRLCGPRCIQENIYEGSQDCAALTMNVYAKSQERKDGGISEGRRARSGGR